MSFQQVKKEGLNVSYKVQILNDDIEVKNAERFAELKQHANLSGFRPGKVPLGYLEQRFGPAVTKETIDELLQNELTKLIEEENLRIASKPKVDVKEYVKGIDLDCDFACELFPDVDVEKLEFAKLKLTDYQVEISDADIDKHIAELAKKYGEKAAYEDEKHKVKKGDFVILNYEGSVDGEKFEGGSAEKAEIEIGSKSMIPGFEDKIIGLKKGDKETIKVKFPKKYHAVKLQKKDAEFALEILEVKYLKDVEVTEEIAKKLGAESLEKLRTDVKDALEKNLENQKLDKLKEELFDYIEEKIAIDLPDSLVEKEKEQLQQKYFEGQGFKNEEEAAEFDEKEFKKTQKEQDKLAIRRVKVGIVLAEIGKHENISVTDEEALGKFMSEVTNYPEELRQNILSYYRDNPQAMEYLKAPIVEEKVVTSLKERGALKAKKLSFEQFKKIYEEQA